MKWAPQAFIIVMATALMHESWSEIMARLALANDQEHGISFRY